MKTINVTFSDDEHKRLKTFKGNWSWREFILLMYNHCIESMKEHRPQLAIINYMLGKYTAYQIGKEISNDESIGSVPIISTMSNPLRRDFSFANFFNSSVK